MLTNNFFDLFHKGAFMFGFNPETHVDSKAYRMYVSCIIAITEVLREYEINIKNKGYTYIVDSIMIILDLNKLDLRLSSEVYPFIRRKYRLNNSAAVEHAIRNAIKSAHSRCQRKSAKSSMKDHTKKPTNKQFLLVVTQEVVNRMHKDFLNSNN